MGDSAAILMMDSKGLCGTLASELPSDDKASAAKAPVIREFLERMDGLVRWLPHDRNVADALTKFRGAHALPLWKLLATGTFTLSAESEVLEERPSMQQDLGYNPRRRVGMRAAGRQLGTG